MIGVHMSGEESAVAGEFFELFKTPWEPLTAGRTYDVALCTIPPPAWVTAPLIFVFGSDRREVDDLSGFTAESPQSGGNLELGHATLPLFGPVRTFSLPDSSSAELGAYVAGRAAGFRIQGNNTIILRLGFDLFREVKYLLSEGQPAVHGASPTLDRHIEALRRWIVGAGVPLIEIPPVPWGFHFAVCLTHDIDFIGLRQHRGDHTMWGFLYRSTLGAAVRFARGRISLSVLAQCWLSAASLPLVHLGWVKDFWLPFPWYLEAELGLPATYYLMPFKGRAGQRIVAPHPKRRATAYDITDISDWIRCLQSAGAEIGVHGIDAWHSVELGTAELNRIKAATGETRVGVRMHWLLTGSLTPATLEAAGYDYDASVGYNEIPGYRAGTTQVYRPPGVDQLLEIPLHIQDGALFYVGRLDLPEAEAWRICQRMIHHVSAAGGVLSVLWHDRSHGPERYWGNFYLRLLRSLRQMPVWFTTGRQVVDWFRARRSIIFQRTTAGVSACRRGARPAQPFVLRIHRPGSEGPTDVSWQGESNADLSLLRHTPAEFQLATALAG
jgi:hypothetical protein